MSVASIVERPITSLRPYERNARTHSKKQIQQIAASITRFGFTNPVLVADDGEIIAGHGCCWLLMALLFVGGVMNLIWVAGLTLLVAAEKLLPGGLWLARIAGLGIFGWGVALVAG